MSMPCLSCHGLFNRSLMTGGRCPACRIPNPTYKEHQRRSEAVVQHIQENGPYCPGYMRERHYSGDLTADHVVPRADGGEDGPLVVLCRSCNSRRGSNPL